MGSWVTILEKTDVLINLTGKSVDCRYTEANKAEILRSRTDSTRVLGKAITVAKNPPTVWLNASSATIYIYAEQKRMTESEGIVGDDFSMGVCRAWEETFFSFDLPQTRQAALRTSIVLGNEGGAYPKMRLITRLGLGGAQGGGQQWMSWIHVADFCRAVEYIIDQPDVEGSVNVTAPHPVRNQDFMRHLRKSLKVPIGIAQPVVLLELGAWLMGTETELLLKSRYVFPEKILKLGFNFRFTQVEEAIINLRNSEEERTQTTLPVYG